MFVCECVCVLGVVIEGRVGLGQAGRERAESQEQEFGKSRWKERTGGSCGIAAGKQGCIL